MAGPRPMNRAVRRNKLQKYSKKAVFAILNPKKVCFKVIGGIYL